MIRAGIMAGLLLGALAGCTSGGSSPAERLLPQLEQEVFGGPIFGDAPEPGEPVKLTRAQLNQIPFATISIGIPDQGDALVVAVADNQGNVVYQDTGRRSIVLRGGLIVATEGLGYNLSAVKHELSVDPVVEARPLADWPEIVTRNYQFSLHRTDDFEITVRCSYQIGVREQIVIFELPFNVTRVQETCANGARQFENTYWVDASDGFVWRSLQWVGPRQPQYTIEIVRPYQSS